MSEALQTTFSNSFSWIKTYVFWMKISLHPTPKGPIDNKPALALTMFIFTPMMPLFTDAYWRHSASMSSAYSDSIFNYVLITLTYVQTTNEQFMIWSINSFSPIYNFSMSHHIRPKHWLYLCVNQLIDAEWRICVGKLTIIGWDNGLSPGRRWASISTNDGLLSIGPFGTNFNPNTKLFIHENGFENIVCEMAAILPSGRWIKCN